MDIKDCKVGMEVIGTSGTKYGITKKEWIGKITEVCLEQNTITVHKEHCGTYIVEPLYFESTKKQEENNYQIF